MMPRIARVLFALGLCAVVWLSLVPTEWPERFPFDLWDKLQHFGAYAALALCAARGFRPARPAVTIGAGLVALGLGLELAQIFLPERSFSLYDLLANALGVGLGLAVASVTARARRARGGAVGARRP